jgi:hypothetical protein
MPAPGPSYLDPGSGGPDNDFTNRNTTFRTWNLPHLVRIIKDAGGQVGDNTRSVAFDASPRGMEDAPRRRTSNRIESPRQSWSPASHAETVDAYHAKRTDRGSPP